VIRKRFLEFVNKHQARALSEAPIKQIRKQSSKRMEPKEVSALQNKLEESLNFKDYSKDYINPVVEMKANQISKLKGKSNKYSVIENTTSTMKDRYKSSGYSSNNTNK